MIDQTAQGFDRAIRVRAETSRLAKIRQFVEDAAGEAALGNERTFDLKVAVSEACANAMEHSCSDAALLEICAELSAQRLTLVVTDTGTFRPPSRTQHIYHSRGLGLPLMVALTDEVRFTRNPGGGTTVSLSMLLAREEQPG